ncbi:50S ribosomal protein L17 [Candidatus Kaiserbacteria bacterium]|nr:50S ribosomal protein L17 [Candidatus Kaiserbacteria bacterium]
MRHHDHNRTLSRTRRGRTALLRGLIVSLVSHGRIVTTEAKAKELRPRVEHLITAAKHDSVASRRLVSSRLGEPSGTTVQKIFTKAAEYAERPGGYTRIVKTGPTAAGRREAVIEFV